MDFLHQQLDFVVDETGAYLIIYCIIVTIVVGVLMKEVVGALICHRKFFESFTVVVNYDIFVSMVEENLPALSIAVTLLKRYYFRCCPSLIKT